MKRTVDLTVFPALNAERVFRRKRCRDDRDTGRRDKEEARPEPSSEENLAKELVARDREQGVSLTGRAPGPFRRARMGPVMAVLRRAAQGFRPVTAGSLVPWSRRWRSGRAR